MFIQNLFLFFAALKIKAIVVMSKVCQLTGKKTMVGNNVSFSHKKTRRKFFPNLVKKRFYIPEEDKWVLLKVSTSAIKIVNKIGITEALKRAKVKGFMS